MSDSSSENNQKPGLSYKDAGVDIDAGNELIDRIKPIAKRTHRPGVLGGLGGFGGFFEIPAGYKEPLLVSGTDGVGTKLKLAMDLNLHNTIGIDLVAMCANDLIVTGAEPLFFLDYYATGKLNLDVASSVIDGIGTGCEQAGCALIGGETAEMPGMYSGDDYDLAGFCVGVVEKSKVITGEKVAAGDAIIGVSSSGPHSNGYSLIRKVIETANADLQEDFHGKPLGEVLLEPTRMYVKPVLELLKSVNIHAIAHITGGGLPENLPRVLPEGACAMIKENAWEWPQAFKWLQEKGNIDTFEMYRTFNCGIGLALVVAADQAELAITVLNNCGEKAQIIGSVEQAEDNAAAQVQFA